MCGLWRYTTVAWLLTCPIFEETPGIPVRELRRSFIAGFLRPKTFPIKTVIGNYLAGAPHTPTPPLPLSAAEFSLTRFRIAANRVNTRSSAIYGDSEDPEG